MWGTLLIGFYLARDTAYRWLTRMSSPLARLAVVFFLSFCGLVFLSNYVISIKVLRSRIHGSGADLVVATEYVQQGTVHHSGAGIVLQKPEEYELIRFQEPFTSATQGTQHYSLVEYLPESTHLFPHTEKVTTYLLPAKPTDTILPEIINLNGYRFDVVTIPESRARLLRRIYQDGAVFIPYGSMSHLWANGFMKRYIIRILNPTAENVSRQEQTLRTIARLDKKRMSIVSSGKLIEQLDKMESTQYMVRVGITIGISAIICLLLTSISSLEFRQNRYVYALIGSFGISRVMLFLSFIVENTLLVALGFAASLAAVWGIRDFITDDLYKSPNINLSLWELEADIRTFCLAFGICVLVSSIPIAIAATRPIGKELK